ncbi:MAG: toll/interleukin-1 receptor domain-containing protein [Verrucomicrobiota bacterium]|nr:toll/interleukin-1 receptor domain-containing protein [Verrucomicrobiota bacterium]
MSTAFQKRDFDLFLSHAHVDSAFVSQLYTWVTEKAGLQVWYDAKELAGGSLLASSLGTAIARCRGVLLVASKEAMDRGWVKLEYNSAMDEFANEESFRLIALRLPGAPSNDLFKGLTWIDLAAPEFDETTAAAILSALYPGEKRPHPATARDVYLSSSWRPEDSRSARAVCAKLVEERFRLIGDAKDQEGFGAGNRIERIISSCGAFVSVVPFRGSETACANDGEYKYFIREIDLAAKFNLPCVVVADSRVKRTDGPDEQWLRMETDATGCPATVANALANLWDEWQTPPDPHYIFYALDLASGEASPAAASRHLIERITGMPTIVGTDVTGESLQSAIMQKICQAFLVLADITDDNVNVCIEAGMAIARGRNVKLIAQGAQRSPPFMLRAAGQMSTYQSEIERVAVLHKAVRPYRRRVINTEL